MQAIRVGFVGLGGIMRSRHIPGLRRIDGVEFVAVANRGRASSERAAAEFGIPNALDRWEDVVARNDVDLVCIGTWPYLHRDVSIAALNAGKHVFCQARMAMNRREAEEMLACARASDRVAGLCPAPIGLDADGTLRRWLREDRLGAVRLVRVQSFSNAFADPDAPLHWRKDHRLSGLNMATLGMYVETLHRWFGPTRAVSAQAQIFTPERRDAEGQLVAVRIPDQVVFNATMDHGVTAQYAISAVAHHGADRIEVYGSKGSFVYETQSGACLGAAAGEPLRAIEIRPEDAYDLKNWSVEREFIDAIRLGTPYRPDFEDGLRYMAVLEAVYDSAELGRTVMID